MKIIEIKNLPIELNKLLKYANLVSSGGEAGHVISEGRVKLNGVVETRKRKKIADGDLAAFGGETLKIKEL